MLEWFEGTGYSADIPGVARKYDLALATFADWAKQRGK